MTGRLIAATTIGFGVSLLPSVALAHDATHYSVDSVHALLTLAPSLLTVLGAGLAAALYATGQSRASASISGASPRALAFYGGLLILLVAVLGPLDVLSASSLTAHMAQHLLLIAVAPPLIVAARPLPTFVRAAPATASWFRRLRAVDSVRSTAAILLTLPVALLLHEVVLIVWHAPVLYDAALASLPLHLLEHAFFFTTALLFWTAVLSRLGRAHGKAAAAIFALFLASIVGNALGSLLFFASAPVYGHYAGASAVGLDPVMDQRLAGGLMWMVGGLFYLGSAVALLAGWLAALDRRERTLAPRVVNGGRS